MVVLHHFILNYNRHFEDLIFIGPLGVDIFFVISGFLITTLCIKEKITTGTLSLKKFYIKRALRILPVAYLYILVIFILNCIFSLQTDFYNFFSAIFFTADISYFRRLHFDWFLAHYWTLSVEEQFYIFLPFFVERKFQVYVAIILVIVLFLPILIYLQRFIVILNVGIIAAALRFLIKFQGIAVGCLFSILLFKGYIYIRRFSLPITLLSLFMIFYLRFDAQLSVRSCFINLIISMFIGLIIVNNVIPKNNFLFKFLNLKILNFIGVLSYSIYIWQQLFLSNNPKLPFIQYPINLILLASVSYLSYFHYENYFLKIKNSLKGL